MNRFLWALPTLAFVLLGPLTPALDLYFASTLYDTETSSFPVSTLHQAFYDFGPVLPLIVIYGAIVILVTSWIKADFRPWRGPCYCIILVYVLGSGLIINAGLKEYWGRPRPRQCVEFGGKQTFRPYYLPHIGNPVPSKSFSCGHCTAGFFFFTFYFLGRRARNSGMQWGGLGLALVMGTFMGYVRMAMGGHFFSDVIASMLIMWLVAIAVDRFVFEEDVPYARSK